MDVRFRPIGPDWPAHLPKHPRRQSCPFKASYPNTLKLLDRELDNLRARDVVIQVDLPESMFRLDGWPRAEARPSTPRVIVRARTKFGDLSWPCNEFADYRDNLRAIGLTLERLRLAGLYGVTSRGEQYTGWKALPASAPIATAMTVEEAARVICEDEDEVDDIIRDVDEYRRWYRLAAKALHPDAGGNEADFMRLQEAKRVLDRHHGGRAA